MEQTKNNNINKNGMFFSGFTVIIKPRESFDRSVIRKNESVNKNRASIRSMCIVKLHVEVGCNAGSTSRRD